MLYLLDTNILIDWYTEGPGQDFVMEQLQHKNTRFGTPWICAAEFCVKARAQEQKSLTRIIESGDLILYELSALETAKQVGELRRTLKIPMPDCIVLATARFYKNCLVTRDQILAKKGRKVWKEIVCLN